MKWFTTQIRVRHATHEYLKAQARASGITITQAASAVLDYAASQDWKVGPVQVIRQPPIVERLADAEQDQG